MKYLGIIAVIILLSCGVSNAQTTNDELIDKAKEAVKDADALLNGDGVDSGKRKGSSTDHPVFDEHPGKGEENRHKGHDIGKGHEKDKGKGHEKHGDSDDSLLDDVTDDHNDTAKDAFDDHGKAKDQFKESGKPKKNNKMSK